MAGDPRLTTTRRSWSPSTSRRSTTTSPSRPPKPTSARAAFSNIRAVTGCGCHVVQRAVVSRSGPLRKRLTPASWPTAPSASAGSRPSPCASARSRVTRRRALLGLHPGAWHGSRRARSRRRSVARAGTLLAAQEPLRVMGCREPAVAAHEWSRGRQTSVMERTPTACQGRRPGWSTGRLVTGGPWRGRGRRASGPRVAGGSVRRAWRRSGSCGRRGGARCRGRRRRWR